MGHLRAVVTSLTALFASWSAADVPPPTSAAARLAPALTELAAPGWAIAGSSRGFDAGNLWEYIDGDAERYVDAGLKEMCTATFRFQGKTEAVVDVYRMARPEAARQIFRSESTHDWATAELGDEARFSAPTLVLRTGADFVRIVAYDTTPETRQALLALGGALVERLRSR